MASEEEKKQLLLLTPILFMHKPLSPPLLDLNSIALASMACYEAWTHIKTVKAFQEHSKLERARAREILRPRPKQGGQRITEEFLLSLGEDECIYYFRCVILMCINIQTLTSTYFSFTAEELVDLTHAMDLTDGFKTPSGYVFDGLEALCLLCGRFRTAGDMYELTAKYDRSQSAISECINSLVDILDKRWAHLLDYDTQHILHPDALAEYADAISKAGAPTNTVWGFIDCTIRRICRPSIFQRLAYNGYKKYHAIKFQAVALPNGLFGHLYGPVEGRRADTGILNESQLLGACEEHAYEEDEQGERRYFQLYGDAAYGISQVIVSPYSGPNGQTAEELEWNKYMGTVRIDVEHAFGIVSRTWPFLNAGWKMQLMSSPVGSYYRVGVLLTNAMNCLRPNQVSRAFDLKPPTLEDYFRD